MTSFKVLGTVNVQPIAEAIKAHPHLWNNIDGRKAVVNGEPSPHREAPDIWIRYNKLENLTARATVSEEHIPVWYPAYQELSVELNDIIFPIMAAVGGEILGGVLITKVPAGKKVYPHKDYGWHVEYYDKIYVQISGSIGCDFCCEDESGSVERFCPQAGEIYLFDNRQKHWVDNDSPVDRITLILCIRTQKFGRK